MTRFKFRKYSLHITTNKLGGPEKRWEKQACNVAERGINWTGVKSTDQDKKLRKKRIKEIPTRENKPHRPTQTQTYGIKTQKTNT